jgi:predicted membrane channel-forming protein YqfA (hemolysin III family)
MHAAFAIYFTGLIALLTLSIYWDALKWLAVRIYKPLMWALAFVLIPGAILLFFWMLLREWAARSPAPLPDPDDYLDDVL